MTDAYAYVRFSTPDQSTGHSLERQWEGVQRFVQERGLNLQDSREFMDLGVSSFRGDNLKQGLGKFLAAVDEGRVARGSYLIVESVDRLSRQGIFNALEVLLSLLRRGITLVTLTDGGVQVLDSDADFAAYLVTLSSMNRAHDESRQKSHRAKAVWRHKKANAATKPVSARCPEWLKLNKATGKFEAFDDRVATIQKMFELADQGVGRHRIVKFLNQNGYRSFRNEASGWQASSVGKLLKNKSLIGSYFPASTVHDPTTGKETRVLDGEEVENYYPVVIDPELFHRVANRSHLRTNPVRGRQGKVLTNLFTGLVYCWWCKATMTHVNKGVPPKGGKYLVCSSAHRGKGCRFRSWPYDDFEVRVLVKLKEVDYGELLGGASVTEQVRAVRSEIAAALSSIDAADKRLENYQSSFDEADGAVPRAFTTKWREVELERETLLQSIDALRHREHDLAAQARDPASFGKQLLRLYEAMDNADEGDRYLVRMRLRDQLGSLIERIEVRALARGEAGWVDRPEEDGGPYPQPRVISIKFHNGLVRTIVPIGEGGYSFDSKTGAARS
jgi:DNA invertase Pin-like site-specific DNA recombinase